MALCDVKADPPPARGHQTICPPGYSLTVCPGASRLQRNMRKAALRPAAALALFAAALCATRAEVIDDILASLSRVVSFLERQHEHINLDGAVGFVVLQGRSAGKHAQLFYDTSAASGGRNLHGKLYKNTQ